MELKPENVACQVHPAATAAHPAPTWLKSEKSWISPAASPDH